jgi:lysyl endopeptidase
VRHLRVLLGSLVAAAVFAVGAAPSVPQPVSPGEGQQAEPQVQPELPAGPTAFARADLALAAKVSLVAPARKALTAEPAAGDAIGVPLQVGFARDVPALASFDAVSERLAWQALADGTRVAAVTITSPGAAALRAGLRIGALPLGATLRFYAPEGPVAAASAQEVRETLARNAASGDASDAAATFWSPVVEGDTLVIEAELLPGMSPESIAFSVPMLSHLVASPRDDFAFAKAASSCNLDAVCSAPTWGGESNAVARIIFTDTGSTFACTGTLLADKDTTTYIPYFLTANHCVSTQAIASSVQAYWFYRSTACNSAVRAPLQTTFGGGTLLYASPTTDTAFLRLASQPPAGVTYAGWNVALQSNGTAVTALHQAGGDLLKISFGNVSSYWNCVRAGNASQFSCNGSAPASSTFYGITWRQGITEGGSSGSGLFTDNGHYLVGQLYGGNGSCTAPGTDFYGRFDVAYNAGLSQWLGASAVPAYTPALDYSDLWWNADQSGWGLSITQHGPALFAAWFVYDSQGNPTWFVMPGGLWSSNTTFTGDIYTARGPDGLAAAFDPAAVVRTRVGSGTLRFASSGQATFSYTVSGTTETRTLTRQPFGNAATVTGSFGDLWWDAAESGWGLALHEQGQTLFGVWFTYRADGAPQWFVMPGGSWSGDTYTGTLVRTTGPGYFGVAFDPSRVTRTPVGTLSIRWVDGAHAIATATVDGVTVVKNITRQPL